MISEHDIDYDPVQEGPGGPDLLTIWKGESDRYRKAGYRYAAMLNIYRQRAIDNRHEVLHVLDTKWSEMTDEQQIKAMRAIMLAVEWETSIISNEINAVLDQAGIPFNIVIKPNTRSLKKPRASLFK